MGTLTADCPRLDGHCDHKLATSCSLWTLKCCACVDERPHSSRYRVYVDGAGDVERGTRWETYCSSCTVFWTNRIAATYPRVSFEQTRIPQHPDQTEFLEQWSWFHQGYRMVRDPNGEEHRVDVVGEPLQDVSPGFLPRTLEQVRRQIRNDAWRPENRFTRLVPRLPRPANIPALEPSPTFEEALEMLLNEELVVEGSDEDADLREHQATQRSQFLLRGIERISRILVQERRASGAPAAPLWNSLPLRRRREIHQQIPPGGLGDPGTSHHAPGRPWDEFLASATQSRLESPGRARGSMDPNPPSQPENDELEPPNLVAAQTQARTEADGARYEGTDDLRRTQATLQEENDSSRARLYEDMVRLRANIDAVNANLRRRGPVSTPIVTPSTRVGQSASEIEPIFQRLHEEMARMARVRANLDAVNANPRHRGPVSTRLIVTLSTRVGQSASGIEPSFQRLHEDMARVRANRVRANIDAVNANPRHNPRHREPVSTRPIVTPSTTVGQSASEIEPSFQRLHEDMARLRATTDAIIEGIGGRHASLRRRGPQLDMDKQKRPAALEDEQMTKSLVCQVCYCQLANIALIPCGHMVLCEWCADTIAPVRRPPVPCVRARCPVCRQDIKQRYKIHM